MDIISLAKESGFATLENPDSLDFNSSATRILSSDAPGIGVTLSRDVLEVLMDHIPTPGEFNEIEKTAGMLITVTITTPEIYSIVKGKSSSASEGAPRAIAPALVEAIELDASDLHLTVGTPPIVRVGGNLKELENWSPLSVADIRNVAEWITGNEINITGKFDYDGSITFKGRRWRVNLYKQRGSLSASLRLIPLQPPRLEELGLPLAVANLANLSSGLVLFAGPTGSGKSTSLAALIDRINKNRHAHILTIEDPIEYQHKNQNSLIHQREVGSDTESFATGLRAAMRQDPDVILVGELRDLETMTTALHAAETGHLVLATVHASGAASAITRLVSSFQGDQQDQVRLQLASSLKAVVCQALIPPADLGSRRALATEVLIVNIANSTMIREDRLHELAASLDASSAQGMSSMERSLANLVHEGKVRSQDAEIYANDIKLFKEYLTKKTNGIVNHNSFDDLQELR